MTWTAKILRADKQKDKWNVAVEYTNGIDTIKKGYTLDATLTQDQAAGMLRAKLAELESFEAATLPFPVGVTLDLTPPAVVTAPTPTLPTQAELDKAEWFDNYQEMQQYNKLIAVGVMQPSDIEVTNMQTWLQLNYLPEYLGSI